MAHELNSQSRILYQGTIFKKGQINKSWKSRWFVLYNNRHLSYFENQKSTDAIKTIDLAHVQSINIIPSQSKDTEDKKNFKKHGNHITVSQGLRRTESIRVASVTDRKYSFQLTTPKRTYLLSCESEEHLQLWTAHLEKSVFGGRLYQGWLTKRGAYRKSWKKRWFVIYDTQEMRYYDDEARQDPKGLIKLHDVLLMCPGDKDQYNQPYTIQLMTPDRNWVLATDSQKERDAWFSRLEETIHGAKRLITSHEGYLWKRGQLASKWKKRYFALSKGWLFYFEEQFHCNKFKSIAFFSEAFFNQAFRLYVKGSIPLHQTTIQKVDSDNTTSSISDDEEERYSFQILTQKREFHFASDSVKDRERWFRAFHSTHNPNTLEEEDSVTITRDVADDDDGYNDMIHTLGSLDSEQTPEPNVVDDNIGDEDDEKKEDDGNRQKSRAQSKTPLMDMLDPTGTGKWVDIESAIIEEQQSSALKESTATPTNDD